MGMHPREGWQADGTPPQGGLSRRGFLKQSAGAGLMMGSLGALLEACGSSSGPTPAGSTPLTSGGIPLPRPNNPVTWPIFKDNHAIASGLAPEQGATLKIYNWVDRKSTRLNSSHVEISYAVFCLKKKKKKKNKKLKKKKNKKPEKIDI